VDVRTTTVMRTVGHSNRPLEGFLRLLRAHQVTLVVDVRKMPGSRRNAQFNRDTLSNGLHEAGIGYVHLPGLGGLRRRTPSSPNAGWKNASFQGYADYMLTPEFERSLEDLLTLARGHRIAVMCAEAVPSLAPQSCTAFRMIVLKTGCTSVGELEMTRRISAVAVCCS
jgi:uncharacterized protein (DUF488 family)